MNPDIDDFLADLEAALPPSVADRARILAEVEDHLLLSRQSLAEGMPMAEAEAEAVRRFGRPAELAVLLAAVNRQEAEATPVPVLARWAAALIGLAASIGLLGLGAWALLDPDPVADRGLRGLSFGTAAMLALALAAVQLSGGPTHRARRVWAGILSSAVVLVGIALVLATLDLGRSSGDYEWYGAGIGLMLAVQGMVGLLTAVTTRRRIVAS